MGRLIDADLFKEVVGNDTKTRKMICELIDKQPTAYNVKKVVEDIKDYSRRTYGEIVTVQVISIVRRGGRE